MHSAALLLAALACALLPNPASPKVFTRCGLGKELQRANFPRSYINNWVCLIESESGKDTSKVTNRANGSKSFGLFQINSREWCKIGRQGGKCNVRCEDMIDENIADDAACALKIFNEKGFMGWDGWKRSCYRRNLFDVFRC